MTARMTAAVGRLTAADGRRLRGRLLPFGRPGYTNLGRVTVEPGDVDATSVPVDRLFASLDHADGLDNVAAWVGVTQEADGFWGEWDALPTHGGDRLLAEFHAGTRTGISVELEPVTIEGGRAKGVLIGCAFPERPAFADARLVAEASPEALDAAARALVAAVGLEWDALTDEQRADALTAVKDAADAIDPTTEPEPAPADPTLPAASAAPTTPEAAPAAGSTPTPEGNTMTTPAAAPAALLAGAAPAAPAAPAEPANRLTAELCSVGDFARLAAQVNDIALAPGERQRLRAALSDIVAGDLVGQQQPAWLGQLWQGNAYQRRIVPLLTQRPLTGLKVRGWRWVTKPTMAKYSGDKAAIPSTEVETEEYNETAQRFAGGNDIDRAFSDFNDTEFFAAYNAEQSNNYALLTDAYAAERMKVKALALTMGTVPSSVSKGWVAIIDGMLSMLNVGTPNFALVEASVWRDMILTPTDAFLEFISASFPNVESATMLDNFRIIPVPSTAVGDASSSIGLDNGEVLVGTSAAVTFRELGGGAPIRAEAIDIANGGVDVGVFGYAHVDVTDNRGLRLIDTDADGA